GANVGETVTCAGSPGGIAGGGSKAPGDGGTGNAVRIGAVAGIEGGSRTATGSGEAIGGPGGSGCTSTCSGAEIAGTGSPLGGCRPVRPSATPGLGGGSSPVDGASSPD